MGRHTRIGVTVHMELVVESVVVVVVVVASLPLGYNCAYSEIGRAGVGMIVDHMVGLGNQVAWD